MFQRVIVFLPLSLPSLLLSRSLPFSFHIYWAPTTVPHIKDVGWFMISVSLESVGRHEIRNQKSEISDQSLQLTVKNAI